MAFKRPLTVFWCHHPIHVDAIRRIQSGTLRMTSAKQEYFETSDIQKKIRAGFASLLSGEVKAPAPFDRCTIAGPVLNEGGLDELEKALRKTVRDFMRTASVGRVSAEGFAEMAPKTEIFARYEGFDAHANAVSSLRGKLMEDET